MEPQEGEGTTGERVPFGNHASTVYARTNRPPLLRVTNHSLWHRWGGCHPGDPGLKPGPRGVPFLRCPGGRSRPVWSCQHPADLNAQAAVFGCGDSEASYPRQLWGAHVENTGSGSHRVQGQRPQSRPGLTQSGAEVDGREFTVGVLGKSS